MKKRRIFSSTLQKGDEINISPLIDIVFILLIFFIVSTVFQEQEAIEIHKPHAVSATRVNEQNIVITLSRNGNIYLSGKAISLGGIGPTIKRLNRGKEKAVIIQADKLVTTELLISVVDEATLAGAKTVNVSTQP